MNGNDLAGLAITDVALMPAATIKDLVPTILLGTRRPGIEMLLQDLEETDFYRAPASTRFHSCVEGGLCLHSLLVYLLLKEKNHRYGLNLSEDSVALTGLLHDVCKADVYVRTVKNVRDGKKMNGRGQLVDNWVEKEVWTVDDQAPLGHGEKSAMMILSRIELSRQEMAMIRWHMGAIGESYDAIRLYNQAALIWPGVVALFTADMEAAHLIEKTAAPGC
jgi:hypothetical protein